MAIISQEPRRAVVVGAGASVPYKMHLANELLKDATDRVTKLSKRHEAIGNSSPAYLAPIYSTSDPINGAVIQAILETTTIPLVHRHFQQHLVQQNLDDFVRDHPSMTKIVATMIVADLFRHSMLIKTEDGYCAINSKWEVSIALKIGCADSLAS